MVFIRFIELLCGKGVANDTITVSLFHIIGEKPAQIYGKTGFLIRKQRIVGEKVPLTLYTVEIMVRIPIGGGFDRVAVPIAFDGDFVRGGRCMIMRGKRVGIIIIVG